jgi:hypothetical protein
MRACAETSRGLIRAFRIRNQPYVEAAAGISQTIEYGAFCHARSRQIPCNPRRDGSHHCQDRRQAYTGVRAAYARPRRQSA